MYGYMVVSELFKETLTNQTINTVDENTLASRTLSEDTRAICLRLVYDNHIRRIAVVNDIRHYYVFF